MPDPLDPRAWNRFGYVYGNPVNFTDPSGHFPWLLLGAAAVAGGLNVGVNYASSEQYTLKDAGWDFTIGAVYGGVAYGFGLAPIHAAVRIAILGGLGTVESATTAYVKGKSYTTNDALWSFTTTAAFAGMGHRISKYFGKRVAEAVGMARVERQQYARSLKITRVSTRAMRSANWEDAASIARYRQEFPNSRMLRAFGNYYMSKYYIPWNKALYQPPLPSPNSEKKLLLLCEGLVQSQAHF